MNPAVLRELAKQGPTLGRTFLESLVRSLPPVLLGLGGEVVRTAIRERREQGRSRQKSRASRKGGGR